MVFIILSAPVMTRTLFCYGLNIISQFCCSTSATEFIEIMHLNALSLMLSLDVPLSSASQCCYKQLILHIQSRVVHLHSFTI